MKLIIRYVAKPSNTMLDGSKRPDQFYSGVALPERWKRQYAVVLDKCEADYRMYLCSTLAHEYWDAYVESA